FGDTAFAVDPEGHAANCRASLQKRRQRVAAIGAMGFFGQTLDHIVSVWAVGPYICVCPETQLEMQPAFRRLSADELEHLEILVPLFVRQWNGAHIVAGN